jgi:hypothetical protein
MVAILWAFCRWSRPDAEWLWNGLASMARNVRKNNQDVIEAVDPTKPLSAGAELHLICWILSTPGLRALTQGKAAKQSVARALQVVWRQAPDIAIFSSRIDRLRSAARVNGTQLADEVVREAKRKIYRNKGKTS